MIVTGVRKEQQTISRQAHRIAVGALFFLLGLCFASWASRIPTLRQKLLLTDAQLGMVLLALPVGSLFSLLISGWLIHKWGSKTVVLTSLSLYGLSLVSIGLPDTVAGLMASLFFFGALGNTVNISVNTQAIGVEALYGRTIMASLHGLWSLAGFIGAAIGSVMIGNGVIPLHHFLLVFGFVLLATLAAARFTLKEDYNRQQKAPLFAWPPRSLMRLGLIALCSMICEGAMFDWSGIYFQKAVGAEKGWVGAGYTAFMCTMATGRFFADRFTNKFGVLFTLQCSGILIATGLLIAVFFPFLWPALVGFLLVGFGVSSVVPLVYSAAGKTEKLSAGAAIAAVSTIGFFGFLAGPPLIGFIAGATSLRVSFAVIAAMGICVTLLASRKKINAGIKNQNSR